jgi:hypothetical protein
MFTSPLYYNYRHCQGVNFSLFDIFRWLAGWLGMWAIRKDQRGQRPSCHHTIFIGIVKGGNPVKIIK